MTTTLRDVRSADWADTAPTAPIGAVLLHGYGSHEHDLTGLVEPLALGMPWASLRRIRTCRSASARAGTA